MNKLFFCVALLFIAQAMGSALPPGKYVPFHPIGDWTQMMRQPEDVLLRNKDDKIINGNEADPNSLPYVVALFMAGGSFCTGSLISNQWVLTAAHCQDGAVLYTDVILGAHRVSSSTNNDGTTVRATDKTVYPNWNSNTLQGDLALIKLPSPATLGSKVQPIKLVEANAGDFVGSRVRIAGWGKTSDASSGISNTLQVAESTVITNAACVSAFNSIYVRDGTICTNGGNSQTGASGTCNGDSGSAMTTVIGSGDEHYQIGITSFGASRCESGSPNGFTRVSYYRQWINSTSGV